RARGRRIPRAMRTGRLRRPPFAKPPRADLAASPRGVSAVPIPVGVVGAGKHGERYLRHIHEDVPELSVRLLCRRDRAAGRAQAERLGARYLDDFRALVASPEIAAVITVVPPTLNVEIC